MTDTENRNELQERQPDAKRGFWPAALCAAALICAGAAGLLFAADRQAEALTGPGVETEKLQVVPVSEEVLRTVASNGKIYPYVWPAEDPEGSVEAVMEEARQEMAREIAWADTEAKRQTITEMWQAELEWFEREQKDRWIADFREENARGTAVVSAQEAANMAGVLAEAVYGVDMEAAGAYFELSCQESSWVMEDYERFDGEPRPVWQINSVNPEGNDETGRITVHVDAVSGGVLYVNYWPCQREFVEMEMTPVLGFYGTHIDTGHPDLAPYLKRCEEEIRLVTQQLGLDKNAPIRSVRAQVSHASQIWVVVTYEDDTYHRWTMHFYREYEDWSGYPTRKWSLLAGGGPIFGV